MKKQNKKLSDDDKIEKLTAFFNGAKRGPFVNCNYSNAFGRAVLTLERYHWDVERALKAHNITPHLCRQLDAQGITLEEYVNSI